jgi:Uma2 family endonuclease
VNAASTRHGICITRLTIRLGTHVLEHGLGELINSDSVIVISQEPATVRMADLSFVSAARMVELGDLDRFARAVPDLAVEVLSPSDSWRGVLAKAAAWLEAGVRLVWIVDPATKKVFIESPAAPPRVLTVDDVLDGGEILPEFKMSLREIFPF